MQTATNNLSIQSLAGLAANTYSSNAIYNAAISRYRQITEVLTATVDDMALSERFAVAITGDALAIVAPGSSGVFNSAEAKFLTNARSLNSVALTGTETAATVIQIAMRTTDAVAAGTEVSGKSVATAVRDLARGAEWAAADYRILTNDSGFYCVEMVKDDKSQSIATRGQP